MSSESYNFCRDRAEHVIFERWYFIQGSSIFSPQRPRDPKSLLRPSGNRPATSFGLATARLRLLGLVAVVYPPRGQCLFMYEEQNYVDREYIMHVQQTMTNLFKPDDDATSDDLFVWKCNPEI